MGRQRCQLVTLPLCRTVFDSYILALGIACFAQSPTERDGAAAVGDNDDNEGGTQNSPIDALVRHPDDDGDHRLKVPPQPAARAGGRRLVREQAIAKRLIIRPVPDFAQRLLGGVAERVILIAALGERRDATGQCAAAKAFPSAYKTLLADTPSIRSEDMGLPAASTTMTAISVLRWRAC
jgi:hypothetical protein